MPVNPVVQNAPLMLGPYGGTYQSAATSGSAATVSSSPGSFADANIYTAAATAPSTNLLWYVLGIFILLIVLKYASEHERARMEPRLIGIGVWNWLAVGIMAMLFLLTGKTLVNKYGNKPWLSGLQRIFNAV